LIFKILSIRHSRFVDALSRNLLVSGNMPCVVWPTLQSKKNNEE